MAGIMHRWGKAIFCLGVVLVLNGCYLPDSFKLNMNIDKSGKYAFTYEGELVAFNFLRKIGQGEVKSDDAEQIAIYEQDIKRDSGFTDVEYMGQARYRVKYTRKNDLIRHSNFSFVRRNGAFLTLKKSEDGLIRIEGDKPNKRYRDELIAKGFDTRGTVRLWTNARVVDHNADEVIEGNPAQYVWNIKSMQQPTPKMVLVPDPS